MRRKVTEGELIPTTKHTIRVEVDDYHFMRALLHLPDPDNFTTANNNGKIGIMSFWDSVSFNQVKEKLDKFKIPYKLEDHGTTNYWDKELQPEHDHTMSPYPSNIGIQRHDGQGGVAPAPKQPAKRNVKKLGSRNV